MRDYLKLFYSEFILTFVLFYLQTVLFCRRFHFQVLSSLRRNVEESGTVEDSSQIFYFLNYQSKYSWDTFIFVAFFYLKWKKYILFFYYASTMAEKRGASSSQKQQVQVYPKIDFCPQQSQPPGSLVFWKNSNCHKISLLVSYGRNRPQMARCTANHAGRSERLEILGAVRQRLGRNSQWL